MPQRLHFNRAVAARRVGVLLAAAVHPGFAVAVGQEPGLVDSVGQSPVHGPVHHRGHFGGKIVVARLTPQLVQRAHEPPGAVDAGVLHLIDGNEVGHATLARAGRIAFLEFREGAQQGFGGFEVAVNPGDIAVDDCSSLGSARLSDPAAPDSGYNYGVVDICATTAPFRAVAYISEGGNIRVVDNGDGTAQLTLNTIDLFDATDPDATITDAGGRLTITGEVTGSTIDGDTTQAINFEFDSSAARACTGSESP